jgi:hypothetical protein
MSEQLQAAADRVVIANATGNPELFANATRALIAEVRKFRSAAPILKGVGRINGDGWKDVTRKGEVVFVWNAELPAPYTKGQYPRIGCEHWSASINQYDFQPADLDEVRELFAAKAKTVE